MKNYPALKTALIWCCANGVQIPLDVLEGLRSIGYPVKALQDYDNTLTRILAIRIQQLRSKPVPPGSFGEDLAFAIREGLNEAWRNGMRQNDVTEMLPEWQDILDGIIVEEITHIPDFSTWLYDVAGNADTMGQAITQAQGRLALWIMRYQDVFNQAIIASADEKTKLEWIYGDTQHCDTCQHLNGIVAYAREWEAAGVHPQQPPNGNLECGGWHCQCILQPTNKRRTVNAYDKIIAIILGGPNAS
jgi:hypothetical protein